MLLFVAAYFAALIATVLAHELAHLLVAIVLRMRPSALVVFGLRFGRAAKQTKKVPFSHVRLAVDPTVRLLGPRFEPVALAGPAADAGLAAYCLTELGHAGLSPIELTAWQTGLATSAVAAVGNLVPVGSAGSYATDGANVARWLLRPARMRRLLATEQRWQRFARLRDRAHRSGPGPDRIARAGRLRRHGDRVSRRHPVPADRPGAGARPAEPPTGASNLLINITHQRVMDTLKANLLAIRALAEVDLGDLAQARRLIQAMPARGADTPLAPLSRHIVDRATTRAS